PFWIASRMYWWPSARVPLIAANRQPGLHRALESVAATVRMSPQPTKLAWRNNRRRLTGTGTCGTQSGNGVGETMFMDVGIEQPCGSDVVCNKRCDGSVPAPSQRAVRFPRHVLRGLPSASVPSGVRDRDDERIE